MGDLISLADRSSVVEQFLIRRREPTSDNASSQRLNQGRNPNEICALLPEELSGRLRHKAQSDADGLGDRVVYSGCRQARREPLRLDGGDLKDFRTSGAFDRFAGAGGGNLQNLFTSWTSDLDLLLAPGERFGGGLLDLFQIRFVGNTDRFLTAWATDSFSRLFKRYLQLIFTSAALNCDRHRYSLLHKIPSPWRLVS
ncbi:hypothetical protein [Rosistilla carotiformis]|uniref:hypothetical protein n=1 Tax=Rosistilla carotiformis TaxID=2528017 RepID=UPI0011A735D5|nr:hypothetical protein [Rosistilla carotiformis]